ncbi:MAG: hypothetical protein LBP24_01980 [Coriobacteriales bacterium]|nr:hypothetical protein [Coriobacteriales bacterium]
MREVRMMSRWVTPAICYSLFVIFEILAVGIVSLPTASTLAFIGLYLLVPALAFILSLLLGASSAHLFSKLAFPPVALGGILLGYLFCEAAEGSVIDLRYLVTDLGLALSIALIPAALGTAIGLVTRAITNRPGMRKGAGSRTASNSRAGMWANTSRPTHSPARLSASPKLRVLPRGGPGTGQTRANQTRARQAQTPRTQTVRLQTTHPQTPRLQTTRTHTARTRPGSTTATTKKRSGNTGGGGTSSSTGSSLGRTRRYRRP